MNTLFPEPTEPTDATSFVPARIVSGGQTGVDRAAFDVAIELSIPHGGWCPAGRLAEDGRIPDKYLVTEMASRWYRDRTEQNVIDSDATLILYYDPMSGGTALTRNCCRRHKKTCLAVRIEDGDDTVESIRHWLARVRPASLNVAGPRESSSPGIRNVCHEVLLRAFTPSIPSTKDES